jgi:HK97 family phage prohead protease
MSKKREKFYFQSRELRTATNGDGSRSISGVIVYDSPSSGLPWTEKVAPGAFADALKPGADVLLLRDHRQEALLARSLSKTLTLEDSPKGLKFTANLSNSNTVATDTIDSISRGDLTGVSFGFAVNKDQWEDDGAGNVTRTLLSVTLYEISCTSFAAFPDSTVNLRAVPKQYRSLFSDPDGDEECECELDENGDCTCDDEDEDEDSEDWAERSRMRLALEQVRSYAHYIAN